VHSGRKPHEARQTFTAAYAVGTPLRTGLLSLEHPLKPPSNFSDRTTTATLPASLQT